MTRQTRPIELYYWATPNGRKITILLEELAVPYEIRFVNIDIGEQFKPEFLAISPNNKIPAIVDPEGPGGAPISVFESGAILKYLAQKFGSFYPADPREQVAVDEWLFWQMGGFGPMLGQNHHFNHDAPVKEAYAIQRFTKETQRLYRVLNQRLEGREVVAGEYSIADMAIFAWAHRHQRHFTKLSDFPAVEAWYDRILARPAVARALPIKASSPQPPLTDPAVQAGLFNQR